MSISSIAFNIYTIILIANIILAFIIIFMERRNPTTTLAWVMVLVFIPVLGFILYLFLGQDLRRVKIFAKVKDVKFSELRKKHDKLLKSRDYMEAHPALSASSDLIRLHSKNADSVFTFDNKVTVLKNGVEKFSALIKVLNSARHHIHMEYYIIRNDDIGKKVRDVLVKKAMEGIKVRLLLDGMGCLYLPKVYWQPIVEAGGEVSVFFPPFLPHINVRVNYRNHRKITVVDGDMAFFGGFNLGDEYLGRSKKYGFWRDTHYLLEGSAVDFLQRQFLNDWQFATNQAFPYNKVYFPDKKSTGKCGVQIVASGPDTKWEAIRQGFFKMITGAKKNIYIHTPYFIPDDSLSEALKIAALSGVDVRIIIPERPDHPFVHWASTSHLSDLLTSGARAYIYKKGFMHSKMVSVDGNIASVGTANFDIRSFKMNFEINALIYDCDTAAILERQFLEDLRDCDEMTLESYAQRSVLIKIKESISRLLSPLL